MLSIRSANIRRTREHVQDQLDLDKEMEASWPHVPVEIGMPAINEHSGDSNIYDYDDPSQRTMTLFPKQQSPTQPKPRSEDLRREFAELSSRLAVLEQQIQMLD